MRNQNGGKFSLKKQVVNNSWYSTHEMVDEDFLWIKSDHTVCRSLDWKNFRTGNYKGAFI